FRYAEVVRGCLGAAVRLEDRIRPGAVPRLSGFTRPPLRRYQEAAVRAWRAYGRRGTTVLPTGAGKTRVALAITADRAVRTLVPVPPCALLEQWEKQVAAFYPGRIGVMGDGARTTAAVTLMTFESAYRWLDVLGDVFDLLVVDEAHHFCGGSRTEALE